MLIPFCEIPIFCQGLINLWITVLMLSTALVLILSFRNKRRYPLAFRNSMLTLKLIFTFLMYQLGTSLLCENMYIPLFIRLVEIYGNLPVLSILLTCILLTSVEFQLWHRIHTWEKNHITPSSIKEAIDNLPSGICVYENSGRIILKNISMDRIFTLLTGDILRNGWDFSDKLTGSECLTADNGRMVLRLSDNTVMSFAFGEIDSSGQNLNLITAQDVTEEYSKIEVLEKKKSTLEALNVQLQSYSHDMVDAITVKEVLNAKIKIHDELGTGLLSIKHYLQTNGNEDEKEQILARIKKNIDFLKQETVDTPQDEYVLMLTTAKTLGVSIVINGTLPEQEPMKHITATGIHECFTNTLRHAKGNMLFINITETDAHTTVSFTNNGNPPSGEIPEKGGLSSLRAITEKAGGTMTISSVPEFRLTITLPKETDNYAL